MFVFGIIFFIFLVIQGYLILEEETLIILASFIWLDAAGGMIRKVIEAELVQKGETIKQKFVWFLNLKKRLITKLIVLHESRVNIENVLLKVYEYSVGAILLNGFSYSVSLLKAQEVSLSQLLPYEKSVSLSECYLNRRVCNYFSLLHKSGSSLRNVKEESLVPFGGLSTGFSFTQVGRGV